MQKMNTQIEEWKAVAECNGEYYVSNFGRVKSLKQGKEKILKACLSSTGYYVIGIHLKDNRKNYTIHKLVALAFLPNKNDKPQVNHKDANKTNNHIDNLEWVTAKENAKHAKDIGLLKNRIKSVSKPVIDILTSQKYNSLSAACMDVEEPYVRHQLRAYKNSRLQRFFYV